METTQPNQEEKQNELLNQTSNNEPLFRKDSLKDKIYQICFVQNKSESEACTILNEPSDKVHYYYLAVKRRLNETQTTTNPQQNMQDTAISQPLQVQDTSNSTSMPLIPSDNPMDMNQFIPKTNGYISRKIHGTQDTKILESAFSSKSFVLITGETGTGKTHLVRHFAYMKKLPYARINLNGGTTAEELIGHWVPAKEGGFKWQDGILTMFVRYGGIVALDEVNACPAEILFALHSLLDDERMLVLLDKDGEVIRAHNNFFLVATMNPDYEGTKPLNEAFKDRFPIKLVFDYNDKIEEKLIENDRILLIADKLRPMKAKGEITTPISTRMLIYYVNNLNAFGEKLANEMFLNNFATYERDAIKNVIEMINSTDKYGLQNVTFKGANN